MYETAGETERCSLDATLVNRDRLEGECVESVESEEGRIMGLGNPSVESVGRSDDWPVDVAEAVMQKCSNNLSQPTCSTTKPLLQVTLVRSNCHNVTGCRGIWLHHFRKCACECHTDLATPTHHLQRCNSHDLSFFPTCVVVRWLGSFRCRQRSFRNQV